MTSFCVTRFRNSRIPNLLILCIRKLVTNRDKLFVTCTYIKHKISHLFITSRPVHWVTNVHKKIKVKLKVYTEVVSKGVPRKRCFERMQQIYRRNLQIVLRHGCSPVNLLHIFRTPFSRNTSGWLHLSSTLSTFSFIDAHLSAVLYNVADCFELICVVFLCLFCIFSMY